MIESPAELR